MHRPIISRVLRIALFTLVCFSILYSPTKAQTNTQPLGIGLETYPYPAPVKFIPLTIQSNVVRMAYMDISPAPASKSNGQTVVLLHGKNFYGNAWAGPIAVLRHAGYRVIVPDQIGFGKSSKPDINYTFDLLASNTAYLLDCLGIKHVAVVGHSTGGMLAVRFALNYPERVTRLVLEDPIGLEDYSKRIPEQTTETLFRAEMAQTPDKLRKFYKRYFVNPRPELYEPSVTLASRVLLSGEYPRWAKASALTYQMIYHQPVRQDYHLLKPRVLLIVGAEDRTVVMKNYAAPDVAQTMGNFPELAKAAGRDIPHCHVVIVPNCGHVPHFEQPHWFNQELLRFLIGVKR